jgi:hypothetical protein
MRLTIFNPKNKRSPYDGVFWQWRYTNAIDKNIARPHRIINENCSDIFLYPRLAQQQ